MQVHTFIFYDEILQKNNSNEEENRYLNSIFKIHPKVFRLRIILTHDIAVFSNIYINFLSNQTGR